MTSNSIKVFIKVRPLITREQNENAVSLWQINNNTLRSVDKQYEMTFDNIYDETKSTEELFEELAKPIVHSALKGINGTIFAYGQTSSGKTYTMMGSDSNPGIIPRTVREIFKQIEEIQDRTFLVRYGYIEIYNEKVFDLLTENKTECLKFQELSTGEVTVNQTEIMACSEEQILESYESGNRSRRIGETNMNEHSSRSHTIFRITIESREVDTTCEVSPVQVSNINLVDLAGSERANQTKADGDRLKEGGHINKSLLALGNVIRVLSESTAPQYINYRDSKLTRILSASLGGNAMTSIICTVTPASLEETYSTLGFAQNAKKIKNKPKVNEVLSDSAIMRRMEREIRNLKEELETEKQRNSEVNKKQELVQHLMDKIAQKEGHFLQSHSVSIVRANNIARRRTWCSSLTSPRKAVNPTVTLPVPPFLVPFPKPDDNEDDLEDELFQPADDVNLDRTLSPGGRTTDVLSAMISTPRGMKQLQEYDPLSPDVKHYETKEELQRRIKFLEDELQESNDFKKVEGFINEDFQTLQLRSECYKNKLASLELQLEELQKAQATLSADEAVKEANAARDKALKEKALAESVLTSVQYEHEQFKERAKKREDELVKTLDEARNEDEVAKLKEKLRKAEELAISVATQTQQAIPVQLNLEAELQAAAKDREKVEKMLAEKREENRRLQDEYDQTSSQLMEAIQDIEELNKKMAKFEALNVKQQLIESILNSADRNESQPICLDNFENDETINQLMQLQHDARERQKIQSYVDSLEAENLTLSQENMQYKQFKQQQLHLPSIEEADGEGQLTELTISLEEKTSDLSEVQMLLESKSQQLLELEEINKNDAQRIKELEEQIQLQTSKIQELEEKLPAEAEDMSSEIAEVKNGLRGFLSLEEENAKLKLTVTEHNQMVEDLTARLHCMTMSKEELNAANGLLEIQAGKIHELEENEINLKKNFEAFEAEQEKKCGLLEARNETLLLEIKEISQLKEINSDLEEKVHKLQEQLDDLQVKLDERNKSEISSTSSNTTEDFETLVRAADQEAEDLRNKLTAVESKINALKSQLEAKQCAEQAAQEELCQVREQLQIAVDQVSQLKSELALQVSQPASDEIDSKLADQASLIATLQIENEALNKERDEINARLTIADEKVQRIEEYLKESQSLADSSVGELEVYKKKVDELQSQIAVKEKSINILEAYVDDKNKEISEILQNADSISKTANDLENLKTKLAEADQENVNLTTRMNQLQQEFDDLLALKEKDINQINDQHASALNELLASKERDVDELKVQHTSAINDLLAQKDKDIEELKEQHANAVNALTLDHKLAVEQDKEATEAKVKELTEAIGKLREELDSTQHERSKLDAEFTNINSKLVIRDGEIESVKKKLKDRTDELEEVKIRLRRRSCDSNIKLQSLEVEKSQLIQQIGAVEAKRVIVEQEFRELQSQYNKAIEQLPKLNAEIEELKSCVTNSHAVIMKHEQDLEELRKSNSLLAEATNSIVNPTSPETRGSYRKSTDLYASQNQQLLLDVRTPPARILERNFERRNRRHDVHDERRRLSSWERFTDAGMQTEAVSEICACSELTDRVKELQMEIRQKDCKIATMKRLADHNPLKAEVEEQKRSLAKEQQRHQQTKTTLNREIAELEEKLTRLRKENAKPKMINQSSQSMDFNSVEKSVFDKLEKKYLELERVCSQRKQEIEELTSVNKENQRSNKDQKLENENSLLRKKLQELEEKIVIKIDDSNTDVDGHKEQFELLQKKYDMTRRLCNLRNDDISKLKAEVSEQNKTIANLQSKYDKVKHVCELRLEKLNVLRERLGETPP